MVTGETLATRREQVAESPDLSRLLARLTERAGPLLERHPVVPSAKALLSVDGGVCPRDGAALTFDPWSPTSHVCPRCGQAYRGERHDRWWARFQHLWLAERAAHLAAVGAFARHEAAARRARELLAYYGSHYGEYPNRDNVLGPSRLFFSTYLESIWVTGYLAGAVLLRESDQLDRGAAGGVSAVADEAANLIGEFDEGLSNRQTWHNAALAAIAVWFEDEELLRRAVEGPTGLVAHMLQGLGSDGMWFEGENYHLFALRGLLIGLAWVRSAGIDPLEEPALGERLRAALAAPAVTALPDLTFPARKDSRFGTSLAQPMYLELWEAGRSGDAQAAAELDDWLAALYAAPAPAAEPFDSYLHEAGEPRPQRRERTDLSWWMLVAMAPDLAGEPARWRPQSALMSSQGLGILRTGGRYVSLEAGSYGGGHGHPDRLHLTLHERGVHWLPDFGAGSYVSRDLFWYRSTLAHNAPLLDGASQQPGDAICEAFDVKGDRAWVRGRFGPISRTVVSGPAYVLDVVELASDETHRLELPWHLAGRLEVPGSGWDQLSLPDELVSSLERRRVRPDEGVVVSAHADDRGQILVLTSRGSTEVLRATAPGPPGTGLAPFVVLAGEGRSVRLVSLLAATPLAVEIAGETISVSGSERSDHHRITVDGWEVTPAGAEVVRLAGRRPEPRVFEPLVRQDVPQQQTGIATRVTERPALDGTVEGFTLVEPLVLDYDDQYRRSEEPYVGPEEFSAVAYANWDDEALYLAVEVTKPDIVLRASDAEPLRLDNEPDDINSDGLQIYLRLDTDAPPHGFLVVPDPDNGGLRARVASGCAGRAEMVRGAWAPTDTGYVATLALRIPGWEACHFGDRVRFDLVVNEMLPDRLRRAGQLVWSGGGGWVWLCGDRQDPARFGELKLA